MLTVSGNRMQQMIATYQRKSFCHSVSVTYLSCTRSLFWMVSPEHKQQLVHQSRCLFFSSFVVGESQKIKAYHNCKRANEVSSASVIEQVFYQSRFHHHHHHHHRSLVALVAGFAWTSVVPGWLTDTIPGSSSWFHKLNLYLEPAGYFETDFREQNRGNRAQN